MGTDTILHRLASPPCETVHLSLVALTTRRNKAFPRHGTASRHTNNAKNHAHRQAPPLSNPMVTLLEEQMTSDSA